MKFSQLSLGDRFIYKGAEYTKSGPLQATEKNTGNERTIMRAAPVEIPASPESEKKQQNENGAEKQIEVMLTTYHQACMKLITGPDDEEEKMQLELQFKEILQALKVANQ